MTADDFITYTGDSILQPPREWAPIGYSPTKFMIVLVTPNEEMRLAGAAERGGYLHQFAAMLKASPSAKSMHPDFRLQLSAWIDANKQAAINSPQHADWSNGVAEGVRIALELFDKHCGGVE